MPVLRVCYRSSNAVQATQMDVKIPLQEHIEMPQQELQVQSPFKAQ